MFDRRGGIYHSEGVREAAVCCSAVVKLRFDGKTAQCLICSNASKFYVTDLKVAPSQVSIDVRKHALLTFRLRLLNVRGVQLDRPLRIAEK